MRDGVSTTSGSNIAALTSLRGIAAMAVVTFHYFGGSAGPLGHGYLGVDLFFLLSGFVMVHVYQAAPASLKSFYAARFARTYPLHLLTLGMLLPAFGRSESFSAEALLCNLTMTQVVCGASESWNSVSWSLSAEWCAYLMFPFVLGPLRRCPASMAALLAAVCLAVLAAHGSSLAATFGPLALSRALPEFLLGMVCYRMFQAGWFAARGWFGASSAAAAGAVGFGAPDVVAVAAFMVLLLSAPRANVLKCRAFVFLGEISFSLYMVHLLMGVVAMAIVPVAGVGSMMLMAAVACGLSVGFATLTYRLVEVPARKALRSWLDNPRQGAGAGLLAPARR